MNPFIYAILCSFRMVYDHRSNKFLGSTFGSGVLQNSLDPVGKPPSIIEAVRFIEHTGRLSPVGSREGVHDLL